MTNHREETIDKPCKEHKVPICQIEDQIKAKQIEYLQKTGAYLSIPRAIIQLILDKTEKA
jgi:hypothetical protein